MANRAKGMILVRTPRSINPAKSVDMDISFDGRPFIPFTAMPDDEAGKDFYHNALNGDYGEILLAPAKDYYWSEGEWVPQSRDVITGQAQAKKDELMQDATARMAPLQDAVDLEMATEAEAELLLALKKYRVQLSRVDISAAPDIVWPEVPDVA